jgi:serine/threonine-protein kinase
MVIAGRYKLRAVLGRGAAAEVWRALDSTLEAPVAIKILDPSLAKSEIAKRFLREARAAAKLRSVHVVQILDHGLHGEVPYIVMELLSGETLADCLDREKKLRPSLVSSIVGQIAKAMAKAHAAGIVHRDLKPANIFLVRGEDEEEETVKIFDFGIAKITPQPGAAPTTQMTKVGALLGTPQYMSPEQATGINVDFRTDIYALGIIAAECLTGRFPFDTNDPYETLLLSARGQLLRPSKLGQVPVGFDAWFAKATALDPAQRFASAKALADALRDLNFGD